MIELELRIGKRRTGFTVVEDGRWSGMYRVLSPGGELSDMVNLTRAKDAAVRLACPRGLGGSDVAHWDHRETPAEAPPIAPNECPATHTPESIALLPAAA